MKRATRSYYTLRDALERNDCLYEDTERFMLLMFDCTQCTTI